MSTTDRAQRVHDAVLARREEILSLILDLVKVPSITLHEGPVQDVYERAMNAAGLTVDRWVAEEADIEPYEIHVGHQDIYADRPNLVGHRSAEGSGGRSIILQGHVDTVDPGDPALWTRNPAGEWDAETGTIYGRGAVDMKAGTLTNVIAMQILNDLGIQLAGDVWVAATVGEEDGGIGALSMILRGYKADAVVITEPTDNNITIAQGGSLVYRITVTGRSAHGAYRNEGVSAIEKFYPIFHDLLAWEQERNETLSHPLYDHLPNKFPISTGVLRAGTWASTVPEILVAEGRLGFLPGERMTDMMAQAQQRIDAVVAQDEWLREHPPVLEWFGGQFDSAEVTQDEPIAVTLAAAFKEATGRDAVFNASVAGLDMRLFLQIGDMPTITYGPGSARHGNAHGPDEWIQLDDVLEVIETIVLTVIDWCGEAEA
ncbi:MAG: ArgE/DapE family deacylase [Thermomicrobiales bacterium]